jgi:ribose transport system ATP-binding protein
VEGDLVEASIDEGRFVAHVIEAMAGRTIDEAYPHVAHEPGETVLEIDGLSGTQLPRRARLELRRGEILGIAGLVGAGRTELLRALFGLDAVREGRVRVDGVWDAGRTPRERLDQGVGLLSENRKEEGLALGLSITLNLTLSKPIARFGVIARNAERDTTDRLAEQLALRYRDARQPVGDLSGGNQQKVALARLLHHDIDVFLFDEPTRGIDVGSKAEIYRLMGQLAQRGKSILFVSSYLPELLGVCDRVAVMSRGRLGEPRPAREWTENSLLEAATAVSAGRPAGADGAVDHG